MADYIDKAKLKAHYAWWADFDNLKEQKEVFDTIIDLQPVEEIEPVLRCRNCRYFRTLAGVEDADGRDICRCELRYERTTEDDYCSRGVRR